MVALAVPLSMAPKCQLSRWPEKRVKSSLTAPARWPVRCGIAIQSVRTRVTSRTRSGPRASLSRSRSASARRIEQHGVRGMRSAVAGVGVPQIVVTIMLWR